mmetsp:Transcript_54703/g.168476  ORF Transcript_54703/g.168476 Transcript_54703/m.168476 type:complete len:824 (-) Transcript_54703:31-2502(-)
MLRRDRIAAAAKAAAGAPLNALVQAALATVLTKPKFVAAVTCPKRLYFLESAAVERHRALMLRRTGARHALPDGDAPLVDGDVELMPGKFTDALQLHPAASGFDSVEPLSVPDVYAAMGATPPPSVLVRLVEQQRVTNWARVWHAAWCQAKLQAPVTLIRGDEESAEAKVEAAVQNWRNAGGTDAIALQNAVVGYSLKLPPEAGGGVVRIRTRVDLLHFVPPGKRGVLAGAPAGPQGQWEAVEVASFIEPRKDHTEKLAVTADFTRHVLATALDIHVNALHVAHINRAHLRKAHQLRQGTMAATFAGQLIKTTRVAPRLTSPTAATEDVVRAATQLQRFRVKGPEQDWSLHFNAFEKLSDEKRQDLLAQRSLCSSACGKCHFLSRCVPPRKHFPNSVFTVPALHYSHKATLWNDGVRSASALPEPHSPTQKRYLEALSMKEPVVDPDGLGKFLARVRYPAVILDFEATQYAVPPHDHLASYDQVPFQFSAHVFYNDILTEDPEHHAFLHLGDGVDAARDPREPIARRLCDMFAAVERRAKELGIAPNATPAAPGKAKRNAAEPLRIGCVIAHNASFESKTVRRLELFSAHQPSDVYDARYASAHLPWLDSIDLARAVTVAEAGGSKSIKNLLPAFAPNSPAGSYQGLRIRDGADASAVYALLSAGWLDRGDATYVRQVADDLDRYCKLDTLAVAELIRGAVARLRAAGHPCPMPTPRMEGDASPDGQSVQATPAGDDAAEATPAASRKRSAGSRGGKPRKTARNAALESANAAQATAEPKPSAPRRGRSSKAPKPESDRAAQAEVPAKTPRATKVASKKPRKG